MFLRLILVSFCLSVTLTGVLGQITKNKSEGHTFHTQEIARNVENDSLNTLLNITKNNGLFWTASDLNDSLAESIEPNALDEQPEGMTTTNEPNIQNATESDTESPQGLPSEIVEDSAMSETISNAIETQYPEMDEKIVLPRNNCNLELWIDDNEDTRIRIMFEPLANAGDGKCCITLNGRDDALIAVDVSNVHLQNGNNEKENLNVVLTSSGVNFVLKQYFENEGYQPLLLTETHNVFVILNYNFTNVKPPQDYTHFNLEAFRYGTKEHKYYHNQVQTYQNSQADFFFKPPEHSRVENIYITTENRPDYYQNRLPLKVSTANIPLYVHILLLFPYLKALKS